MYDPEAEEDSDKIQESGLISSKFRAGRYSLPNSIDAVFFDYRDKITYFFKGEYVSHYYPSTHACIMCILGLLWSYLPSSINDCSFPSHLQR